MSIDKLKLLFVVWRDAEADVKWDLRDVDNLKNETLVYSTGWLLAKDEKYMILCADFDRRGMSNRSLQIPVGCIVSCRTLPKVRVDK